VLSAKRRAISPAFFHSFPRRYEKSEGPKAIMGETQRTVVTKARIIVLLKRGKDWPLSHLAKSRARRGYSDWLSKTIGTVVMRWAQLKDAAIAGPNCAATMGMNANKAIAVRSDPKVPLTVKSR